MCALHMVMITGIVGRLTVNRFFSTVKCAARVKYPSWADDPLKFSEAERTALQVTVGANVT